MSETKKGVGFALIAYLFWGHFPLYWSFLSHLDPLEVVAHRIVWSAIFLCMVMSVLKTWRNIMHVLAQPKRLLMFAASGFMLAANWLIYIWAVKQGQVLEASLGYFMTPLMSVMLGACFLKESLRPYQWLAVSLAALGVMLMSIMAKIPPWIAIAIAASFGAYGLVRKIAAIGSLEGLILETAWILLPALVWLILFSEHKFVLLGGSSLSTDGLLITTGIVTTLPLLAFASAARRLNLATLGILQYLSPSIQFLLGVWLFNEVIGERLLGFIFIWLGLIIFSVMGVVVHYSKK